MVGLVGLLPGVLVLPLEPVPPLAGEPLLGVLGLGELGDGVVLLPPVAPPVLLPLAGESDLKCASHSEREICPSLLVSTIENVGSVLLAPLEALPLDDDPAAMDTPAIAKSAAAVAVLTSLNIWTFLLHKD